MLIAVLALGGWSAMRAQVPDAVTHFPNNVTGTPGTLLYRQTGLGRVTNIAYHNGFVYTHEVAAANPRRWRFTDIENPASLSILATGWQNVGNFSDHGTHGHYKVGDWLAGQWAANIRRVTPGVNTIQDMPGFTWLSAPNPADGITRMYYPWGVAFNWIEYEAVAGEAFLYRGAGPPLAQWPALAQHGVAGNSILLGNLLFITSDESNMGVLCYDISPVFATPSQPPVLLDKLSGSVGGYICAVWENFLVFSRRDTNRVDIVDYSDPTDLRFITSIDTRGSASWDLGNGLGYVQCQDNFIFTDRHKINMEGFNSVLELDEAGLSRPAGSVGGALDTSQHLMPLGNLLISGGYSHAGADGVGVWIHQAEPDRRAPYVGYHVPRPGQTNFPLGAPVSLLIHENLESYTIVNGESVILRPVGGAPVAATVSFSYDDVLTITPTAYLQPDTTYEVEIVEGGIKDAAGNGIEGYSFTFSTGGSVAGGNASPQISAFGASPSPAPPGSEVTLTAAASDPDAGDVLEYRFTFGDGSPARDWSPEPSASHVYAVAGHHGVKVQVRDVRAGEPLSTVSLTGTVNISPAPPAVRPTKSSPIALDPAARRVWVVNPDNDSVSLLNADTRTLISEIGLNALLGLPGGIDPRSVAVDAAGHAWVACRDADRVVVLDGGGGLVGSIDVGYGSAPMGVAITADGGTAFVSLEGWSQVRRYATASRAQTGSVNVGPMPRAIAITPNGGRVLVTRFISGEEYGQVYDVNPTTSPMTLTRTIPLHRDRGRDGSSSGRGVPNYVSGITISPDGAYAYYTAVKANTQRGTFFDQGENTNDPLDPDNTVRAMVGRIDLSTHQEPLVGNLDTYRIDVDNSDSPTSVEFSPSGDYFFVSIQGNNHVAVFDDLLLRTQPQNTSVKTTKGRFPTGGAPQGLVFDPVANRLFSADFLGRGVTSHDLGEFLAFGLRETGRTFIGTLSGPDKLDTQVLLGKRLFYQAADASGLTGLPDMSLEGYISCASCHADGQHDGMTWDFTQRGEGFRNTTDLRGRAGTGHGNVHWTGNFDEVQDFLLDIMNEFGGTTGWLPEGQAPNPPLGAPNAGRGENLDALAAYVTSLGREALPRSPHRNGDGSLSAGAEAGASIFATQQCATCHGGAAFTDSTVGTANLHDVGTRRTSSGQRMGQPLPGIDTPTLLGLWATAPYFHDGSAKTLEEVFRVAGGTLHQAEDASFGGSVFQPGYPRLNEDSSMRGNMVYLGTGDTVTFSNVDGGIGGAGDLELRWLAPFWGAAGTVTVTVNGTPHNQAVTRPFGSGQPGDHWQRLRFENVNLNAGGANTIVVSVNSVQDSGFDELVVTTASDRAAASAHRGVMDLPAGEQAMLLDYLRQLDGSSPGIGTEPQVTLTLSPGQEALSARPYAEFDIAFSEAVQGLEAGDFELGGTASPASGLLTSLEAGLSYRFRVPGLAQPGTVTLRLPAASVTALDDGAGNLVSALASVTFAPEAGDDVAPLSDEFEDPASISGWQRNYVAEGWGAASDKLEVWDIDTSRPGHMRVMPYSSSWYEQYTGAYAFKQVTGDFVATLRMQAARRNGMPGRPTSAYSLGGIMVRTPRGFTNAAPNPDPGPGVVLPYPPPPSGQPNHYTTPWTPNSENYIFLSYGNADVNPWGNVPNTWYCEIKTTLNGASNLYAVQTGIPANTDLVTLQMVRIGQTFVVLRRHGEEGQWIVENRFVRNDMPATLQLGITTYTDWNSVSGTSPFHHNRTRNTGGNPDLVVDAEYFRLRRPEASLTEADLLALPVTAGSGGLVMLGATAEAGVLGDAAGGPHVPEGPEPADIHVSMNGAPLASGSGPVDLGSVAVGGGLTRTLTVENLGWQDLSGLSVSVTGPDSGDVSWEALPAASLVPGAVMAFDVTFSPGAGTRFATLQLMSSDPDEGVFSIPFQAEGLEPPAPEIALSVNGLPLTDGVSQIDFGPVTVGGSLVRTITVENTGTADLTGLAVSIAGTHAGEVAPEALPSTALSPGASLTFDLTFTPGEGLRSATLQVESDDVDEGLFTVSLRAEGLASPPGPLAPIAVPSDAVGLPAAGDLALEDAAAGIYDGLLRDVSDGERVVGAGARFVLGKLVQRPSGAWRATSGVLIFQGRKIAIKGSFNGEGRLVADFRQKDGAMVSVDWELRENATTAAGHVIRGTVSLAGTAAQMHLAQAPYHAKRNPVPPGLVSRYSMLLPSEQEGIGAEPGGHGWAVGVIRKDGTVVFSGALGDGRAFSDGAYLSGEGEISLFALPYRKHPALGFVGGRVVVRDIPGVSDFDGAMRWVKAADVREARYPQGFARDLVAVGSRYLAPAKNVRALSSLANAPANATLGLVGAPAPAGGLDLALTWAANNRLSSAGGLLVHEKLAITVNPKTGVMSAAYLDRIAKTRTPFSGAVFQKQQLGAGVFLHGLSAGQWLLEPVP